MNATALRTRAIGHRVLAFALSLVLVLLATALTAGGSQQVRPLPIDYGTEVPATPPPGTTTTAVP